MADAYGQENLLSVPQDLLSINRLQHPTSTAAYGDTTSYTTASPVSATYAPSTAPYDQMGYAQAPVRSTFALGPEADHSRRYSHSLVKPARPPLPVSCHLLSKMTPDGV